MSEWAKPHECVFPEVKIGEDDEDGVLKAGMLVLLPCDSCGDAPRDYLDTLEGEWEQMGQALLDRLGPLPLFHWSPRARRNQILRYGLRPGSKATTSSLRAPYVCFADSPSWAWALSAGMKWAPKGEWDLWETDLHRITEPKLMASPDRATGIYEVRTLQRVWKRDIWHVGTKEK